MELEVVVAAEEVKELEDDVPSHSNFAHSSRSLPSSVSASAVGAAAEEVGVVAGAKESVSAEALHVVAVVVVVDDSESASADYSASALDSSGPDFESGSPV